MSQDNLSVWISTKHVPWRYFRQIPSTNTEKYFLNEEGEVERNDFLVVYDEPHQTIKTSIPKKQRILFVSEPPEVKTYPKKFLQQFGTIVTPYEFLSLNDVKDTVQFITQSALPWHYGVDRSTPMNRFNTYEDLKQSKPSTKQNKISVVCSKKTITTKQKKRLAFVERLKKDLGDTLDIFGRGFHEINDKAEGIDPYKFHIVLENNDIDNFWTEKLADCFLGYAFPFYSGGDVSKFFDAKAYLSIDIDDYDSAFNLIENCLKDEAFYADHFSDIEEARNKILSEYNLFSVVSQICKNTSISADLNKKQTIYGYEGPCFKKGFYHVVRKIKKIIQSS